MGRGGGAKEKVRGEEGERKREEDRGCNERGAAGNSVEDAWGERNVGGTKKIKNKKTEEYEKPNWR